MKKYIYITVFALVALMYISLGAINPVSKSTSQSTAVSITNTPIPVPKKPSRLTISKLNIDTMIEHVGNTESGAMDVPKNSMNVAWYSKGFYPGARGNAVIAGHYDTKTSKAVFYDLKKLEKGDEIVVYDENQLKQVFKVVSVDNYTDDDFPLTKVFGDNDKRILNLITCSGIFDKTKQRYSDRTVVTSELFEGN